jgi:hypothetical protein
VTHSEPGLFQSRVVVGIDAVVADNCAAAFKDAPDQTKTDEAGGSGNEN